MNRLHKVFVILRVCLVAGLLGILCFSATPVPVPSKEIVGYIGDHLSTCGTLEVASNGLVYLKVDENYIDQLFPMLEKELEGHKLYKPGRFAKGNVGAHVSVIQPEENQPRKHIQEIGQKYCFSVVGLYSVKVRKMRVYYLKITAIDLQKLREKYGLPAEYKDHDLHITLAWEKDPGDKKNIGAHRSSTEMPIKEVFQVAESH